ncbi:MAG: AAA family ATPase [Candidatus Asgardarchaeia archaeon]
MKRQVKTPARKTSRNVAKYVFVKILSPATESIHSSELLTYICTRALQKVKRVKRGSIKAAHLGDVGIIFKVDKIIPENATYISKETVVKIKQNVDLLRQAFTEIQSSNELFWPQTTKDLFINALKSFRHVYENKIWDLYNNSILLAGPPGSGKSQGAVTIAKELNYTVYEVDIPTIVGNKYAGETAERISLLKQEIMQLDDMTLIIFNDFEILAAGYYYAAVYGGFFEIRTAILSFLDSIRNSHKPIMIVGTSNVPPEYLDNAILDRFSLRLIIAPSLREKIDFVLHLLNRISSFVTVDVNLKMLEPFLEQLSMRAIKSIVRYAANKCLVNKSPLTTDTLLHTIKEITETQNSWKYVPDSRRKMPPHYV